MMVIMEILFSVSLTIENRKLKRRSGPLRASRPS
jgi:hypothetical protein